MVGPYDSENRDWFLRFGRFLFSAKFRPILQQYFGSDLEPKGRKIKIKKQRRRRRSRGRRRQRRRRKKAKNEEINPHSKQPSSCEPKHVTNFQMTNPSILLFFFVSSSPPDANFFFFFLVLVISIQAIEILQEPLLSFVLIFSFMNPSM